MHSCAAGGRLGELLAPEAIAERTENGIHNNDARLADANEYNVVDYDLFRRYAGCF